MAVVKLPCLIGGCPFTITAPSITAPSNEGLDEAQHLLELLWQHMTHAHGGGGSRASTNTIDIVPITKREKTIDDGHKTPPPSSSPSRQTNDVMKDIDEFLST